MEAVSIVIVCALSLYALKSIGAIFELITTILSVIINGFTNVITEPLIE